MIYLDTGCLVKLYYPEPESALVAAKVSHRRIAFTSLHELEITNALRLKRFHKTASISQIDAALQLVQDDVKNGVLEFVDIDWPLALRQATELSNLHTKDVGSRSLDIIHCAAAMGCKAAEFLSTDLRQCKLAQLAGLNVVTL
jgi:predicted nucleic acid-binding protein